MGMIAIAALGLLAPCAAAAQVLEIEPDGTLVTHAGPALYLTPDMRPQAIERRVVPASLHAQPAKLPADTRGAILTASAQRGISPELVAAVAWQESRFDAAAISPKGARGVMQLMPGTARLLGVDANSLPENILGGTTYLALLLQRYDGDLVKTLAAYNAGPGAVDRFAGVPPYRETQRYVNAILDRMSVLATTPSQQQELFP